MILSEKDKEIIEKVGVFHEKRGLQPVMGRIIGLLLVAEPAEATFEEIVETLQVSKSAVSTALTLLQAQNSVEYETKPGERKRYFKLATAEWREDIKKKFDDLLKMEGLVEEVLELKKDKKSDFCGFLFEMKDFLAFLRVELPRLVKKFDCERNKSK